MLTVKEFAAKQGVTPAIIYRHIQKHSDKLEGLIIKRPRQTLLTDEAQEYIRSLMVDRTLVVASEASYLAQIDKLREERDLLSQKLIAAQETLTKTLQELGEQRRLTAENTVAQDQKQRELEAEITRLRQRTLWQRIRNRD